MTDVDVEKKLFYNRYIVDIGHPHIKIRNESLCVNRCITKPCIVCCPAGCYTLDDARVLVSPEGCLECGSCRIVCGEFRNVDWAYPRGGYGVQYKFG